MARLGARRARDAPIQVVDVRAADQMSQAQHVRNAMAGSSSQPQPIDLASINVRISITQGCIFSSAYFLILSHLLEKLTYALPFFIATSYST